MVLILSCGHLYGIGIHLQLCHLSITQSLPGYALGDNVHSAPKDAVDFGHNIIPGNVFSQTMAKQLDSIFQSPGGRLISKGVRLARRPTEEEKRISPQDIHYCLVRNKFDEDWDVPGFWQEGNFNTLILFLLRMNCTADAQVELCTKLQSFKGVLKIWRMSYR